MLISFKNSYFEFHDWFCHEVIAKWLKHLLQNCKSIIGIMEVNLYISLFKFYLLMSKRYETSDSCHYICVIIFFLILVTNIKLV